MTRLLSGVVLAAGALASILFLPPTALRLVVVALALLGMRELLGMAGTSTRGATSWLAYGFAAAVAWTWGGDAPRADLVLFGALGILLIEVLFAGRPFPDAAATVAGGLYVGLPLGVLAAIHAMRGRDAVLLLLGAVVVSDSSQYYTGRLLGRRPLAPSVSPKKTIEGALGGVVFGTAAMVLGGSYVLPDVPRAALVGIGVAIVALGICGDLFESRMKRAAGIKDSSNLIPGHGGVLDRIDALLFAAPAFYLFLVQWA